MRFFYIAVNFIGVVSCLVFPLIDAEVYYAVTHCLENSAFFKWGFCCACFVLFSVRFISGVVSLVIDLVRKKRSSVPEE